MEPKPIIQEVNRLERRITELEVQVAELKQEKPICSTERFDIFHTHITRREALGCGRDVFTAWYHSEDVPCPVCVVTLFGNWVEWVETCSRCRRQGIATEVIKGIESVVGCLEMEPGSDDGENFLHAYEKRPKSSAADW